MLGAWRYAIEVRALENFYQRLIDSSDEATSDPRFQQISESCLLDSLLRGWKLAFSDDETEKKFERWSRETRETVWADLWKQAAARNLDLRAICTEGTIFQVTRKDGRLIVRPRFVADITQTHCVRSREGGVVGYTSAWFKRKPVYYHADAGNPSAKTPEELADRELREVEASVDAAIAEIQKASPNNRVEALRGALKQLAAGPTEALRTALCTAPERAVARLVRQLLDLWPEPAVVTLSKTDREICQKLDEFLNLEDDPDAQWKYLAVALDNDDWPFADEYLAIATHLHDKAAKEKDPSKKKATFDLADQMIETGRKIDPEFITTGEKDPAKALKQRSAKRRDAEEKLALLDADRVVAGLRIVTLFDEAESAFDSWDDTDHNRFLLDELLSEIQRAPSDIRTPLSGSIQAIETVLERDQDPRDARSALADMQSYIAGHTDEVDRTAEMLRWRIDYLAGRLERSPGPAKPDTPVASSRPRVLAALQECVRLIEQVPKNNWLRAAVEANVKPLKELMQRIESDPDYDAIDRQKYREEVTEIASNVAEIAVAHARQMHERAPSRRTLEVRMQLEWGMGLYSAALQTLLKETLSYAVPASGSGGNDSTDDFDELLQGDSSAAQAKALRALFWGRLVQVNEDYLLKACVYSGGEFFGTSVFGRRMNDWVRKPKTVEQVVVRLEEPKSFGLNEAGGEEFGKLYRDVVANPPKGPFATPRKIGDYKIVEAIPASFTDVRVFRVIDEWGNESIVKVIPKDGDNLLQMEATVRMTDYLARQGVNVPSMLPIREGGGKVLETADAIIIRETRATGTELAEIAEAQGGRLTAAQERLYIDTTLDMAVRGKGIYNLTYKDPVLDFADMRGRLLERADESLEHFETFARTQLYQQKFGMGVVKEGSGFDTAYRRFVKRFWKGDQPIKEVGLVHDGIMRNYFLDGEKMTVIDVGSDFVGSVGNDVSTMLTQLQPKGVQWSFQEYAAKAEEIIGVYEKKVGRQLNEAEKTEIIQHLSFQPYRMLSSDSGRFLAQIREACGLPYGASEAELTVAMRKPENLAKVEEFLTDPAVQEKFDRHMLGLEHSLMFFGQRLPAEAVEDRRVVSDLIEQVRHARNAGMRVVLLPGLSSDALAAAR